MTKSTEKVSRSIQIRADQWAWVEAEALNLSKWIRLRLDEAMGVRVEDREK